MNYPEAMRRMTEERDLLRAYVQVAIHSEVPTPRAMFQEVYERTGGTVWRCPQCPELTWHKGKLDKCPVCGFTAA